MKIILEKPPFIAKLLGVQNVKPNTSYRKLDFLEFCEENGIFLVYNMLTFELAELTAEEYGLLSSGEFSPNGNCEDLISRWMAVPTAQDDAKLYEQMLTMHRLLDTERFYNHFTILTTTDCNARCFYCYEKGIKHVDMTAETARDVAKFIINHCKNNKADINWFGGEPLYNKDVIDIIINDLKAAGIKVACKMVSNGYLFDAETVKKAKEEWNLKSVQITLDGTRDVYNRCKNYIHPDPNPFARVCDNIALLLESKIIVRIRMNLDKHNKDNLLELIEFLGERFTDKRYLAAYIALLFDFENKRNSADTFMLSKTALELEQRIIELGISIYGLREEGFSSSYCMADNDHSALINPEGDLARCEHYPNDYLWGTIWEPDYNSESFEIWKKPQNISEECRRCKFFIRCHAPEKCPSFENVCSESKVMLLSRRTKCNMLAAYKNYIKKSENS